MTNVCMVEEGMSIGMQNENGTLTVVPWTKLQDLLKQPKSAPRSYKKSTRQKAKRQIVLYNYAKKNGRYVSGATLREGTLDNLMEKIEHTLSQLSGPEREELKGDICQ